MLKDFRDFILKGNVLDMAVGIIIGAAFGTVVKSLVDNVIMPPIGLLISGIDFSKLKWVIGSTTKGEGADAVTQEVSVNYGTFINDLISLMIVGFCVFLLTRAYMKARAMMEEQEKKDPAPEEAPAPSEDVKLLTEIRDLLKAQSGKP